jgi:hypothetical protein
MKKYLLLSMCLVGLSFGMKAQTVEDLLGNSYVQVTWLGIDFSHVKLIGEFNQFQEAGETGPELIKSKYFPAWNELIIKESDKYNVAAMIRKENVEMNIEPIMKINAKTDIADLEGRENPNYTEEEIREFVKKYNFGDKEGIGMLFIAESMNKTAVTARYHFVAINLSNNEVILQELFNTVPGGFGLRNYWAKSFYLVIDEIEGKKYKQWKKAAGIK